MPVDKILSQPGLGRGGFFRWQFFAEHREINCVYDFNSAVMGDRQGTPDSISPNGYFSRAWLAQVEAA